MAVAFWKTNNVKPFYSGLMSANDTHLYIKRVSYVNIDRYLISDLENDVVSGEEINIGSFPGSRFGVFVCSDNYLFGATGGVGIHRLNLTNTTSEKVAGAVNYDTEEITSPVDKMAIINGGSGTLITKIDRDYFNFEDLTIRKYDLTTINDDSFVSFGSDDTALNNDEDNVIAIVSTPNLVGVYWFDGTEYVLQIFDSTTLTTQYEYKNSGILTADTFPVCATTEYRGGSSGKEAFFLKNGTSILVVYDDGTTQNISLPGGYDVDGFTYGINHNPTTDATLYLNYDLPDGISGKLARCEGTTFTWIN